MPVDISGGSGSGGSTIRRLGKDIGLFGGGSGSGGTDRSVFVYTSCPGGTRKLAKYVGDWPAFWTSGSGSGSGGLVYVPSRPVFAYGECAHHIIDNSPENCFGWDGLYVPSPPDCSQVIATGQGMPTTLVATFPAISALNSACLYGLDNGVPYSVPLVYHSALPINYSGDKLAGWFGSLTITSSYGTGFGNPVIPAQIKVGIALICYQGRWRLCGCPLIDGSVDLWLVFFDEAANFSPPGPSSSGNLSWLYGDFLPVSGPPPRLTSNPIENWWRTVFVCKQRLDEDPNTLPPAYQPAFFGFQVCGCVEFSGSDGSGPPLPSYADEGVAGLTLDVYTPFDFFESASGSGSGESGSGSGGHVRCPGSNLFKFGHRGLGKHVGRLGRKVFVEACCPGSGSGSGGLCDLPDVIVTCDGGLTVPGCLTGALSPTSGGCTEDINGQTIELRYSGGAWHGSAMVSTFPVTVLIECISGSWVTKYTITHSGIDSDFFAATGESSPGIYTFSWTDITIGDGCVYDFAASFSL